jgi:porin
MAQPRRKDVRLLVILGMLLLAVQKTIAEDAPAMIDPARSSPDMPDASSDVEPTSVDGSPAQAQPRRVGEYPSHPFRSPFPRADLEEAADFREHYLLGDWWGARSWLASRGIKPTMLFVTDPFGNPTGGVRQGFGVYNLLGMDLRLETEPLLGWPGGEFHVGFANSSGKDLSSEDVGNAFPIQLAAAGHPSTSRLTYLSYTQLLFDDLVGIRVGRLTINAVNGEEFMGSEYFKAFTSVAFDLVPLGPFLNAPGAYGYPFTTWGARVKVEPDHRFYAMVGVYNGDPDVKDPDRHGVDFSLKGPVFVIGELGLRWREGAGAQEQPGNLKVGAFFDAGGLKPFDGAATTGQTQALAGVPGLYVLGDQVLISWGKAGENRHLGAFAAFTLAPDQRVSTMPYFFDTGFVAYGALPSRPKDFIALGLAYGQFSRDLRSAQEAQQAVTPFVVVQEEETAVEIGYGCAVLPGLLLQPDLQVIIHPNGDRSTPTALALGVNVVINF